MTLKDSIAETLLISLRGGPGSGNFGHHGREGEQGGSAPTDRFYKYNVRKVKFAKSIQDLHGDGSDFSIPYFLTKDGKIVDTEGRDHPGYMASLITGSVNEIKRIFGVENPLKDKSVDRVNGYDLIESAVEKGAIRVRWYKGRSVNIQIHDLSMKAIERVRKLIDQGLIPTEKKYTLDDNDVVHHDVTFIDASYEGLMSAKRIVFNEDEFDWELKGGPGSGNFGHHGIPGHQGGSQSGGVSLSKSDFSSKVSFKTKTTDEEKQRLADIYNDQPESVRSGVRKITVQSNDDFEMRLIEGGLSPYSAHGIAAYVEVNNETDVRDMYLRPLSNPRTKTEVIQHEFGHIVWDNTDDNIKGSWERKYNEGQYRVTPQCDRGPEEAFSECYNFYKMILKYGGGRTSNDFWGAEVYNEVDKIVKSIETQKGGAGSGNFGHAGRVGIQGGSAPQGINLKRGPLGSSIREAFELPEAKNQKQKDVLGIVEKCFNMVDKVHGDFQLRKIPIVFTGSSKTSGSFVADSNTGKPLRIEISTAEEIFTENDLSHEIGHYIDRTLSRYSDEFANQAGIHEAIVKVTKAIRASQGFTTLKNLPLAPPVKQMNYRLGVEMDVPVDKVYLKYLLGSGELFARAYSQYIATRSKNKEAQKLTQIEAGDGKISVSIITKRGKRALVAKYPIQWNKDDFEPIAKEFDGLFEAMGWIG